MDRRYFNQAMMALAASATLPAFASQIDIAAYPSFGPKERLTRIGLVSVGGADGNTVATIAKGLSHVTLTIAIDTDASSLSSSGADRVVFISEHREKPQHPRQVYEMARRQEERIEAAIDGLDLLIVVAGMYGAAGKGLTPIVAKIANRKDICMLCLAITPAQWTGLNSSTRVQYYLQQIQRTGAVILPINSQWMPKAFAEGIPSVAEATRVVCEGLGYALNQGEIIGIELDDLRLAMEPGSVLSMSWGYASGTARIQRAVDSAIAHPLMGIDRLTQATGLVINFRGGKDLPMSEIQTKARELQRLSTVDPYFLYSASIDESIGDKVIVSIFANSAELATPVAA